MEQVRQRAALCIEEAAGLSVTLSFVRCFPADQMIAVHAPCVIEQPGVLRNYCRSGDRSDSVRKAVCLPTVVGAVSSTL